MKQPSFKTALTNLTTIPRERRREILDNAEVLNDERREQFFTELQRLNAEGGGIALKKMEDVIVDGERMVKQAESRHRHMQEEKEKTGELADIESRLHNI